MKCTTVITTFNRLHCIEAAINSVLTELPDHEVVIVDDASTDGTAQFVKTRYVQEIAAGVLSIHCLTDNVGVTGAKNVGYEQSRGDWVLFLDSDDYYPRSAGEIIQREVAKSDRCPIVFFRCRTQTGKFVGDHEGKGFLIDLETYLRYTSFGEALTAVNKRLVGSVPPYVASLRGYEGLGCARLLRTYGPGRLSDGVARIYVTNGEDRLSVNKGFILRMPLLAKGHLLMIRDFFDVMRMPQILNLLLKALVYISLGGIYRILVKD